MSLRMGFYYHIPAIVKDSRIFTPGYFGRFLDSLAEVCDQLIYFAHMPHLVDLPNMDYSLKAKNLTLVSMGPRVPAWKASLFSWPYSRLIREWRGHMDVMLIRGPSPLLPALARVSLSLPIALLLVGDYVSGVNDLPQPIWRKELIRIWSKWNKRAQVRVAQNSLTFVNTRILYDELKDIVPDLRETRTTALTESDFYFREDTCQSYPYHILYAGRMDRSKGLLNILEAVALLVQQGEDLIFDLVGPAEKGDPLLEDLIKLAEALKIDEKVVYHGYKPFDPDLLSLYKKADIFVIASLSSFEGFPRVIWEAMANSLPVVATRVGSIPAFIEGAAELIEPRDINALAGGISHIIHDEEYRKQCINRGFKLIQTNTLKNQVGAMVQEIETWVSSRSR